MSRFFSKRNRNLVPYIPGEQPKHVEYIKLNTNESPYPPSPLVEKVVKEECSSLSLYSDPECLELRTELAKFYKVSTEHVIVGNGSDEILNLIFLAYGGEESFLFPDVTYGFYPVYCNLYHIPYKEIPLDYKLSININDYMNCNNHIVIANPNAPTGTCLTLAEIEAIIKSNKDTIVVIDEAYIDFGGDSAIPLIHRYDNVIIVQTFSKSRSMAGARLGYAIASESIIKDLNTIRYSINPYNVNRLTLKAGIAAIREHEYYDANCKEIIATRQWTFTMLINLGFDVIESKSNFLFARSNEISGCTLYEELKEKGILIRHFNKPRIIDYIRITIGTKEQMEALIQGLTELLVERREEENFEY